MKDFYAIDKGKYQIYVDFASFSSKDYTTEHIWEVRNGHSVMVSSKVLGKSSDFDTDEKREELIEIITNQQIENLKIRRNKDE